MKKLGILILLTYLAVGGYFLANHFGFANNFEANSVARLFTSMNFWNTNQNAPDHYSAPSSGEAANVDTPSDDMIEKPEVVKENSLGKIETEKLNTDESDSGLIGHSDKTNNDLNVQEADDSAKHDIDESQSAPKITPSSEPETEVITESVTEVATESIAKSVVEPVIETATEPDVGTSLPSAPKVVSGESNKASVKPEVKIVSQDNKVIFLRGDEIRLSVKTSFDGYLSCYMDSLKEIVRIFPNRFSDGKYLSAGTEFPIPNTADFSIIAEQHGETILCLVTEHDVSAQLPQLFEVVDFAATEMQSLVEIIKQYETLSTGKYARSIFFIKIKRN